MPIIKTVKGDLLQMFEAGDFNEIVHGCNCFHAMGGGIAAQIARKFPEAADADRTSIEGDPSKLGSYTRVTFDTGRSMPCGIINAYTQYDGGRENPHELYANIAKAFRTINESLPGIYHSTGVIPIVGIPQIGAGIAGGDWTFIEQIINDVTPAFDIVVVEYAPPV